MSTTKKIYFLSAIVLIIGCFALNLSYSLFVQTEEKDIVSASVPNLASSLATTEYTIPTGEYFIKQTVYNNGTADMLYALNVSSTSTNYTIKAVNEGTTTYNSYGTLEANTSKDLYFYIKNENSSDINLSFSIDKKYTTLNNDLTSNIDNDSIYVLSLADLPYSDKIGTLAYTIIKKDAETKQFSISNLFNDNNIVPVEETNYVYPTLENGVTSIETEDVGIYQGEDDYGTSYYYRGAQSYNYVNFAGFTWRIVRINGDGSIRLILDGTLDKVYRKNEDGTISITAAGTKSEFNSKYDDNAYEGYMYGEFTENSTSYNDAHENKVDSTIKDNIDLFYETYIESDTNNYHYEKYLADTLFCGDKTLASTSIGSNNTGKGFGKNVTYYAASERLYYSNGTTLITTATPTLECAKGATNTYSRYTSKKDMSTTTTKGVSVNNDLSYPIALLSADELVMAGGWGGSGTTTNKLYYLYDAFAKGTLSSLWWTMSPYFHSGNSAFSGEFYSFSGKLYVNNIVGFNNDCGSRPVINLRADSLINSGKGTYEEPYTIKEITE